MKKTNFVVSFLTTLTLVVIACNNKKQCILKEVDRSILDSVAMYAIYASDTCWTEMIEYADRVTIENRDIAVGGMYIFINPESSGKVFLPNSFALAKTYTLSKIMSIYDSSLTDPPYYIEKFPEWFKKDRTNDTVGLPPDIDEAIYRFFEDPDGIAPNGKSILRICVEADRAKGKQ